MDKVLLCIIKIVNQEGPFLKSTVFQLDQLPLDKQ